MPITDLTIGLPNEGINNTDPPFEIGDYQAQLLKNLRVVTGGLETIRPSNVFSGYMEYISGASEVTDSVLVYRPTNTQIQYLFAHAGRVYAMDSSIAVPQDIGYIGTITARIRLLQYRSKVFIFNGVDLNRVWDGTNLWGMGIDAPLTAPGLSPGSGVEERTYYYTYYNPTWDVESDPSPDAVVVGVGSGVYVDPAKSDDPQVTLIRIYRTGSGIVIPRLALEVENKDYTAMELHDTTLDADVSQAQAIAVDHTKPTVLSRGWLQNNRLFARELTGDTLWVSNEYEPWYMPVLPFINQDQPWSGGPIDINPGDGGDIQTFVPWGGAGIAFKNTQVYRIQETEVGFYSYQAMGIPPCVAAASAVQTPYGIIYLGVDGFVLLAPDEQVIRIGAPIKYTSDDITDLEFVEAVSVDGYYVVSFKSWRDEKWYTATYTPEGGWQGMHDIIAGSSYYLDSDGILYIGRSDMAGILKSSFRVTGLINASTVQDLEEIKWIDKAREFTMGRYSRIKQAVVVGKPLGNKDQTLTLNVYDQLGILLTSSDFVLTQSGSSIIGIADEANGQFLAVAIEGLVDRPVRFYQIRLTVEIGARVQE